MSSVFTVQLSSQHSAIQHVTNIVNTIIQCRVLFVLSVMFEECTLIYESTSGLRLRDYDYNSMNFVYCRVWGHLCHSNPCSLICGDCRTVLTNKLIDWLIDYLQTYSFIVDKTFCCDCWHFWQEFVPCMLYCELYFTWSKMIVTSKHRPTKKLPVSRHVTHVYTTQYRVHNRLL